MHVVIPKRLPLTDEVVTIRPPTLVIVGSVVWLFHRLAWFDQGLVTLSVWMQGKHSGTSITYHGA
ncbi:MAG: hypothetical protein ACQEXG_08840 [Pseudomonadota bacterium]